MAKKSTLSPLEMYMKTRASLKDEPVGFFFFGEAYRKVDLHEATAEYPATGGFNPPNMPLFKVAGFNIARAYYSDNIPGYDGKTTSGYYLLTREIMLYLDPKTEEVLDYWDNPYIPVVSDGSGGVVTRKVQVLHVDNDPVNQIMTDAASMYYKYSKISDSKVVYNNDIFLKYPSPLAGEKYSRFSANDIYQGAEMFRFIVDEKELLDPNIDKIEDVTITWTRFSQYLPWMHMGQAPGGMVIATTGYKCKGGAFEGLPEWYKKEVLKRYPKYVSPPEGNYPIPNVNETSWSYFKKQLDSGKYIPTQIP